MTKAKDSQEFDLCVIFFIILLRQRQSIIPPMLFPGSQHANPCVCVSLCRFSSNTLLNSTRNIHYYQQSPVPICPRIWIVVLPRLHT